MVILAAHSKKRRMSVPLADVIWLIVTASPNQHADQMLAECSLVFVAHPSEPGDEIPTALLVQVAPKRGCVRAENALRGVGTDFKAKF